MSAKDQNNQFDHALTEIIEIINHDPDKLDDLLERIAEKFPGNTFSSLHQKMNLLAKETVISKEQVLTLVEDLSFVLRESEEAVSKTIAYAEELKKHSVIQKDERMKKLLNDLVLTQEFQDLCGQRVKQVNTVMKTTFETWLALMHYIERLREKADVKLTAPLYQGDSVHNQKEVDDLMKDLGLD